MRMILPHRLGINNVTDVTQEVMHVAYVQHTLPRARCLLVYNTSNQSIQCTWVTDKHELHCTRINPLPTNDVIWCHCIK